MNELALAAEALGPKIIEWRRELHRMPELSHDLPRTAEFVLCKLREIGVDDVRYPVGEYEGKASSGIVAEIKGGGGATVALRADMDGLPLKENTGLPFASDSGNMHACGHDAHTAMLLGAASLLAERRDALPGNVRLLFQAAEETTHGALAMIDDGAMTGVDAVVGLHVSTKLWDGLKAGEIGIRSGCMMASSDRFIVKFVGKGGHGAAPHLAVDPVVIACGAVCRLQTLVSRELDPLIPAVVTVGSIHGGTAFNVIPGECIIDGTLRTARNDVRGLMCRRIREVTEGTAADMRGSAEFTLMPGCSAVENDEKAVDIMERAARETLGADAVRNISAPTMSSEDFSFLIEDAHRHGGCGAFFALGAGWGDERDMPHHNAKFTINESVLWRGAVALAAFALSWKK